jgi:FkbM family methyltransferase
MSILASQRPNSPASSSIPADLAALRALVMSDEQALLLDRIRSQRGAPTGELRTLCPIALGGREFRVREGTSDSAVFLETFQGLFHLPPIVLPDDAVILDFGASIGSTAADLAFRYPRARLLCVEMDPGSADLCRMNTEWFAERRHVVQGAVWVEDGRVKYGGGACWSRRVRWIWDLAHPLADPEIGPMHAIGIHGLIDRAIRDLHQSRPDQRASRRPIDYIKMDIEGSEAAVFEGDVDWLRHVNAIRVHVHAPTTIDRIISRLTTGGMIARRCWKHHRSVVGLSPAAAISAQRWPEPAQREDAPLPPI